MITPALSLHPRSRFAGGYDFPRLLAHSPALKRFVAPTKYGSLSIDFANPDAVKALNQALLKDAYGLDAWDLPPGYLCPPIPGRSDYVHHLADLLNEDDEGRAPGQRHVLDIGTGASVIYPLIAAREYGWQMVGTELDPVAVRWARRLVAAHPSVRPLIQVRVQPSPGQCFAGVVEGAERFDASMCNPPFHGSAREAAEGNRRKRRNLGTDARGGAPLNFGGIASELWCEGGELGFIGRMIAESAERPTLCRWFTTLVSKRAHVPQLRHALRQAGAADVRVIPMAQGQKQSRILAWTFVAEHRPSPPRHMHTRSLP